MDLVLHRKTYSKDGIFGELCDLNDARIFYTLEHAYPATEIRPRFDFLPKIPGGRYACTRGEHQLEGMIAPFWTFEIDGVEGHSNLLFHWGNYNQDSSGCILIGDGMATDPPMLLASKAAFAKFMDLQSDCLAFYILIIP